MIYRIKNVTWHYIHIVTLKLFSKTISTNLTVSQANGMRCKKCQRQHIKIYLALISMAGMFVRLMCMCMCVGMSFWHFTYLHSELPDFHSNLCDFFAAITIKNSFENKFNIKLASLTKWNLYISFPPSISIIFKRFFDMYMRSHFELSCDFISLKIEYLYHCEHFLSSHSFSPRLFCFEFYGTFQRRPNAMRKM